MPRVAVVQMHLFRSESVQEFITRLDALIGQAAIKHRAELVALPAHVGLCLLNTDLADLRVNPPEIARATRGGLRQAYEVRCGELAAKYRVYLAPGTVYVPVGQKVYHIAYLFGPDGKIVGAQAQTHRGRRDRAWDLAMADALGVIDTPVGRIGFVIGADLHYPEVARILRLQGADVLIHPGERGTLTPEERLAALWREVQANQTFGLEPCLVGRLAAEDLEGPSAVLAPCELTSDGCGVLATTASARDIEVIHADLDFGARQALVERSDLLWAANAECYATQLLPAVQAYRRESPK